LSAPHFPKDIQRSQIKSPSTEIQAYKGNKKMWPLGLSDKRIEIGGGAVSKDNLKNMG
jgi:hypothetical protein